MNYKDKLEKAKVLHAEATEILTNPESTAEDKVKIEGLMEEAKGLRKEAMQLKDIEAASLELKEFAAEEQKDEPVTGGSEFKSWGEFLVATYDAKVHATFDPRLKWYNEKRGKSEQATKQMVEMTGASGGFLVPTEFLARLEAVMAENAIVRPRATILPMRRRQLDVPVLDQTGTTAGYPHWFGGMIFYWAEEAASKTITEAEFNKISLVAHKLIGYTRASDELLDDSAISLEAFLAGPLGFTGGAVWMEDFAFIQGTGVGQPLGIIPAGATITVPRAADATIGFTDICDMMENFLPTGNGVWIITQSAMSEIIQMNGPALNPAYVWINSGREAIPGMIFGYPVIWTEKCPLIGEPGDIILADLKYYLIGDRQATTVESTKYDQWQLDLTSWRMVHRVDGQPWLESPLVYQDGTTEISPFVILGGKES